MMDGSISGRLKDGVPGQILLSPTLSLTRDGVLGETTTHVDEQGRFPVPAATPARAFLAPGSPCAKP
jgi:hypothetical protein